MELKEGRALTAWERRYDKFLTSPMGPGSVNFLEAAIAWLISQEERLVALESNTR